MPDSIKVHPSSRNPFLSLVMHGIRSTRVPLEEPYFNRVEKVPSGLYGEVWFRTAGCTWDAQGGCTMCNYGFSQGVSSADMIASVKQALSELPPDISELLISPSGSMFDEREVETVVRDAILKMAAQHTAPTILVEARAETVTRRCLQEFRTLIPDKNLVVEIGLESADPWIQKFCVNKGSHPELFLVALQCAKDIGIQTYANVNLGTAFLSPAEAIADAELSARWALKNGSDAVVIFPLHAKPFTLLAELVERGAYKPPSLWSLLLLLKNLGPGLLPRVEIAWYKSYYTDARKIHESPNTCSRCYNSVVRFLDTYRQTQSHEVVLEALAIECGCKDLWRESLTAPEPLSLADRVAKSYGQLANLLPSGWWNRHQGDVFRQLRSSTHWELSGRGDPNAPIYS